MGRTRACAVSSLAVFLVPDENVGHRGAECMGFLRIDTRGAEQEIGYGSALMCLKKRRTAGAEYEIEGGTVYGR